MNKIEKVYICLSILPFIALVLWVMRLLFSELGHDAEIVVIFIAIFSLVLGILGVFLIFQARKRKTIFWTLILATLLASSFSIYMLGHYYKG